MHPAAGHAAGWNNVLDLFLKFSYYPDSWLSLDPNLGTAAQRFIRAVNNFAGTINCNFMSIVIRFVSLHRYDWFTLTALRIASDHVLVYVYIFFHLCLSVCAQVRVSKRPIWRSTWRRRASSSFSCLPSWAAFAINALITVYRIVPYMSNLISSYPQLAAWSLLLDAWNFYFILECFLESF